MSKKNEKFIDSIAPSIFQVLVLVLAVAAAFYIGKLTTQVKFYENNSLLGENAEPVNPSADQAAPMPQVGSLDNLELLTDGDHVRGDVNAKIAIIEYSDIDCPFCGTFHETAKQVVEEYNGEVMWIYRHLPLDGMHPEARSKAIATECVSSIGGNDSFWEFLDEAFETGAAYDQYSDIAASLGINSSEYENCLVGDEAGLAVDYDMQKAGEVGVQGTPGNFVVNLETEEVVQLRGAEPLENVKSAIESLK